MEKLLALALVAGCGAAAAQTPAANPMPDGSRDLYLGLGVLSAPRYEGARLRRSSALPVLQFEWSNGIFLSGMSAGVHLSNVPSLEYGPLLVLQPRRNESGSAGAIGGVDGGGPGLVTPPAGGAVPSTSRLEGIEPIGARVQAGGFFNVYLSPRVRWANSLLGGAGNQRNGATWRTDLQRVAAEPAARHAVSLSAGLTLANRAYQQAFFGVTPIEAQRSGYGAYQAAGGLKDAHLALRWNWALAPEWMLTSGLQATRLLGSARRSPLAERPASLTGSAALAARF